MWAVTYTVNDYDQHGRYILVAWADKPSKEVFRKVITGIDSEFYNDLFAADTIYDYGEYKEGDWEYEFRHYEDGEEIN